MKKNSLGFSQIRDYLSNCTLVTIPEEKNFRNMSSVWRQNGIEIARCWYADHADEGHAPWGFLFKFIERPEFECCNELTLQEKHILISVGNKPECEKSPTSKHCWKWTQIKEDRIKWPRGDWGAALPKQYCIHCREWKEDKKA